MGEYLFPFSNHKEFTYKPSIGLDIATDLPASDSFGDNLITEREFHDPLFPHRRIPLSRHGVFASDESDGLVDVDNVKTPKERLEKTF